MTGERWRGKKEAPGGRASFFKGFWIPGSTRSSAPDKAAKIVWRETLQLSSAWLFQEAETLCKCTKKICLDSGLPLIRYWCQTPGIHCNLPRFNNASLSNRVVGSFLLDDVLIKKQILTFVCQTFWQCLGSCTCNTCSVWVRIWDALRCMLIFKR